MDAFQEWLVSTPINGLVLNYAWSWPTLESLHFLALCVLMGSLLIMDLRLIGFNRPYESTPNQNSSDKTPTVFARAGVGSLGPSF